MAKPIAFMAPEFTQEGWYLKAYQSNTTIELNIYLDEAETIFTDKVIVNADGFFEHEGNEITPRVGGRYDLFLFPDADSADKNLTSKAIRLAQETAAEILIGDGGSIEKATQDITGIGKFEGTDDSGGSIVKNITNSRDAIKLVFETLKYTQDDLDNFTDTAWVTPEAAFDMITDNVLPVTENWAVGKIIYSADAVAISNNKFLKMDGADFNGNTYPRLANKSFYKSKKILDLPTVNTNVEAITTALDSKPIMVRADDTFFCIVADGDRIEIHSSTDGISYSQIIGEFNVLQNSFNNVNAAYDGDNNILIMSNGSFVLYDILGNSFSSEISNSRLANPYFCHFNTRLNKYMVFSYNAGIYYVSTITKAGVLINESEFASTNTGSTNTRGVLTNGNDGSGNVFYSVNGNYFIVFDKISDTVIYKIGERFLNDAFNENNNLYNMTTGGSPLLDGSIAGISTQLPNRGAAVNSDSNLAIIDYATDLQTSILVMIDGVFSYKVIDNSFTINGESGIIPLGGESYILTGDNGDGIAYTKDSFETITTNSTDNTIAVGKIGTGSAIFLNESNKYIIMLEAGTDGEMRYVDITATKSSEYATIDMTARKLGETSYYVFAGTPE